jgi:hypothetical protein
VSRVVITLDDTAESGFESSICYEGGFSRESPAHCTGLILMKHLYTLADPQGDERVFGGAPSARESIQGAKPEDASDLLGVFSGISLNVTQASKEEEHRVG